MNKYYLPAEWHRQSLIQLTWPHEDTDWAYMLSEVEDCFLQLTKEITKRQPLLIVTPKPKNVKSSLQQHKIDLSGIMFFECPTNDTWARDHAFITLLNKETIPLLLDFRFNGWGMKFAANLDNQINARLFHSGILKGEYKDYRNFVLEGGSIESDGKGTLLTTSKCLLAPNRNEPKGQADIETFLKKTFGLKQVLWLHHGFLTGDDTDNHVDTIARLCPDDTIAYVQCTNPTDEHYEELFLMEEELRTFRTTEEKPFRLLPLPMVNPIYDKKGLRLPATYANFLIMNEAVLYPTYNQPENDQKAYKVLTEAFSGREIVGVDCRALIQQHGSLHCVTMQYPENVFKL